MVDETEKTICQISAEAYEGNEYSTLWNAATTDPEWRRCWEAAATAVWNEAVEACAKQVKDYGDNQNTILEETEGEGEKESNLIYVGATMAADEIIDRLHALKRSDNAESDSGCQATASASESAVSHEGALQSTNSASAEAFQDRVDHWLLACFGEKISRDKTERNHRFLEEALELVQSGGCTRSEAYQLVDYVYGRDVGEMMQEVGGVMNTLAALCLAYGINLDDAADVELKRCWQKIEKIRAKQAAKPKHSPLPQHPRCPIEERSDEISQHEKVLPDTENKDSE